MNLSQLYSRTKRAVEEFHMIEDGDRIAVAVSGGKDSLVLVQALFGLSRMKDKNFELTALLVELGYESFNTDKIEEMCTDLAIPFYRIKTEIGHVIFEERKEKNPCSMCAKMRKGALNKKAMELGCNKIAYGHHRDDFNDTLIMSMFNEGRLKTLEPEFYMSKTGLHLIRPLLYVKESEIIELAEKLKLPVEKNPCPADGKTAREESRQLLASVKEKFPDSDSMLFTIIKDNNYFIKKRDRD